MNAKKVLTLLGISALLMLLLPLYPASAISARQESMNKIEPLVLEVLVTQGQADVLVILQEQADLGGALALKTKEEKGGYVYRQLTEVAERTQPPLRAYLDQRGAEYHSYWIRNMIRVRTDDPALIRAVAGRPEVARIEILYPDELDPVLLSELAPDQPAAVGWNLQRVRADDVWGTLGITGSGVLVGVIDSGVDWDHPGLINAYRPWVPGAPTRHDYNWYDGHGGSQTPVDYTGHGTAMTGLVVGDDGGANQTGMAPGAQWIGCSMLSNHGMDCLQFMLAPTKLDGSDPRPDLAPHVLSNSWVARVDYEEIIDTLYFAGIMFVKAAENDGYDCGTVSSPGSLPRVTAVGAFEQGDTITSFSSRGPMLYNGQPIIKPNLAAPGMNCPTTTNGGGYGASMGTSAACPHVTGAVALILSARPDLAGQVDTLQMILEQSADPMVDLQCPPNDPSGIPNNVWGYGILNAYQAVVMAQGLGLGDLQGQVVDGGTAQPIAEAKISFEDSAGRPLQGTEVFSGSYTHTLPAATYTVTVESYGYHPGVVGGVVVISGGLTIEDISLTARSAYVLSGTIRAAESGAPLSATVAALYTPLPPVQSDPATGFYSLTLAEGSHTLQVEAFQRLSEEHPIVVDQDQTLDLELESIPFIPYPGNPVLEPGTGGAWDSLTVVAPNVVFVDGTFYLFYLGSSASNPGAIGYATSSNGVNFSKYAGNPILSGDGSGFDADYVGFPTVLVENGTWIMHYVGQGGGGQMQIGRATAPAPSGPWTRNSNPVLAPGSFWEWDGSWMLPNNLFSTGSSYVLYYSAAGIAPHRSKLGRAISADGITWSKYNDPSTGSPYADSDPVMLPGPPGAWDYRYIFRSSVQQTAGGWEVFYGAYGSLLLDSAVGYANSVDGIHWSKDARNPILHPKDEPMAAAYLQNPSVVQVGSTDWLYYDDMEYFDDLDTHIGVATRTISLPAIVVEPLALEATLYADEQLTQTLWISNVGGVDLTFNLVEMRRDAPPGRLYADSIIDPELWSQVQAQGQVEAIIYLRELADLSPAYAIGDWEARGRFVYERLRETAERSGGDLFAWLEQAGAGPRQLLAANAIVATVDVAMLEEVARQPEVARVSPNSAVSIPPLTLEGQTAAVEAVEWNIAKIRADEVWSTFGLTGAGITVGDTTTGVMYTHPALTGQYRGNLGGGSFDHNYNWFDLVNDQPLPYDDNGHGTLATGFVVGDDGGTNQIGVAPGAKWIAFKAIDSAGNVTLADLHAALDWMLAPTDLGGNNPDPSKRPQVGLNAWGSAGCDAEFQPDLQAWRAAGILPVFPSGPLGPACDSMASPGDLPEAFSTGSTDSSDSIASWSSRGPSCWGEIKPKVAAPGVNIRSSYNDGGYYVTSGTSWSAAHLAGAAALVLSAAPTLTLSQVESIITSTAVCLQDLSCGGNACPENNNVYGWGRIDAFEAVSLTIGGPPPPYDIPWLAESPLSGTLAPGEGRPIDIIYNSAGLTPGVYLGLLEVESNDPLTPNVNIPVTLTVLPPCQAVAIITVTRAISGCLVTFGAELSGTVPYTYSWDFGALGMSTAPTPTVDFGSSGTYPYTLTVGNCQGTAEDSYAGYVTVTCLSCEPVTNADLGWVPPGPSAGQVVTFTASASGTAPITFAWDFGDGVTGTGQMVTHVFTPAGSYTVTLTASNGCGVEVVRQTLTVLPAPTGWEIYLPIIHK